MQIKRKNGVLMLKKTHFFTAPRESRISLWVDTPDMGCYNIWDLPKAQMTPDVLSAIKHAFELGVKAYATAVENAKPNTMSPTIEWEHKRKEWLS